MKTNSVLHDITALRLSAADACCLLKVLANEGRLLILCELNQGTRNVRELEELLDVDKNLGPEMKSTGEMVYYIKDIYDPFVRGLDSKRSMFLSRQTRHGHFVTALQQNIYG